MANGGRSVLSRLSFGLLPRARPMVEQGVGGQAVHGGYIRTVERSSRWIGRERYRTASEIVTNISIVAAGVHHFLNLIAHPKWTAKPPKGMEGDSEAVELAEFVEEILHDMKTPWPRVVRRAGMYRFHGFAILEWIAKKRDDGRIGFKDVESRPQFTIERWELDDAGTVLGVWQRSPQTGETLGLPRSKLMYMVEDTLSDSPEGLGIFRHLAEPYERLRTYLALEAKTFERDLRGIPVGRAPLTLLNKLVGEGKLKKEDAQRLVDDMKAFVEIQVKQADTGLVLDSIPYESTSADGPKVSAVNQWGLDLLQGSGLGLPELGNAIDRIQREMARIIGVEQIMMGGDRTGGSRALSEDKSRNLYLIANSVLTNIASGCEQDLLDPLWILNNFDEAKKPRLEVEDVAFKEVAEITAALRDMAQAGATLRPDDAAIDDIRDMLGISRQPEIDEETLNQLLGLGGGGPDDDGSDEEEDMDTDDDGEEDEDDLDENGDVKRYRSKRLR